MRLILHSRTMRRPPQPTAMWGIVRASGTPLSDSDNGILRRMAPATSRNRMRSLR